MSARPAEKLSIAVAQLNSTVGDIAGNAERVRAARATAAAQGADIVVFPELFIAGYPPEDLVLKPAFQAGCRSAIETLARDTSSGGPALLVGTPWLDAGKRHNAVALLEDGVIAALRYKVDLPNYGVFDEKRVFAPGPMPGPVNFRGVRLGIPICEDIWGTEVVECLAETGAEMLVVPNGSPYWRQKGDVRINIAVARVTEQGLPTIYVNQVGGQDELVFDGVSFGLHSDCSSAFQLAAFQESVATTHWVRHRGVWRCENGPQVASVEADHADYSACVLGLRDYVNKNGFPGVVLGLSGGIDSALTAALAAMALGPEHVHGVFLPSEFTSQLSVDGTHALVGELGISLETYAIDDILASYLERAEPSLQGPGGGVALENLQARIRGNVLMNISNSRGWLVLATGNKSELSMGYCTLYGDMAGGYAVIKDLLKSDVYRLCRFINEREGRELVPGSIMAREPSAELRGDQRDSDSLPPYEVLDPILEGYIENGLTVDEIAAKGFARELVEDVVRRVDANEYKRRQAPVGIKITPRAFGRDWRLPISAHRPHPSP